MLVFGMYMLIIRLSELIISYIKITRKNSLVFIIHGTCVL